MTENQGEESQFGQDDIGRSPRQQNRNHQFVVGSSNSLGNSRNNVNQGRRSMGHDFDYGDEYGDEESEEEDENDLMNNQQNNASNGDQRAN